MATRLIEPYISDTFSVGDVTYNNKRDTCKAILRVIDNDETIYTQEGDNYIISYSGNNNNWIIDIPTLWIGNNILATVTKLDENDREVYNPKNYVGSTASIIAALQIYNDSRDPKDLILVSSSLSCEALLLTIRGYKMVEIPILPELKLGPKVRGIITDSNNSGTKYPTTIGKPEVLTSSHELVAVDCDIYYVQILPLNLKYKIPRESKESISPLHQIGDKNHLLLYDNFTYETYVMSLLIRAFSSVSPSGLVMILEYDEPRVSKFLKILSEFKILSELKMSETRVIDRIYYITNTIRDSRLTCCTISKDITKSQISEAIVYTINKYYTMKDDKIIMDVLWKNISQYNGFYMYYVVKHTKGFESIQNPKIDDMMILSTSIQSVTTDPMIILDSLITTDKISRNY